MIIHELAHPIVQAPMAGGPSTPALAAAVSEAGGLGFIAAGYRSAAAMAEDIGEIRRRTSAAFGVNVFVPRHDPVDQGALATYLERLDVETSRYGQEVGQPRHDDDDWAAKLAVLEAHGVPVVSFTFECPDASVVKALKSSGAEVWMTVTEPAEAATAAAAGADVLVLQGVEAGGHRGSFTDHDQPDGLGVIALLRLVAADIRLPLVATGGLADGAAVAGVLAAGAAAAQLGTAFMRTPEAGTNAAHREALATETPTALTRAFTGRHARGLVNRFMLEHAGQAPAAYPEIHYATAPLRAVARERRDKDGFNLWAGQAHRLSTEVAAGDLVRRLSDDARAALASAASRFASGS